MINKSVFIIAAAVVASICVFVYAYFIDIPADDLSVHTYQVEKGWGYKIVKKSKTIIDQPYMPCLEGNNAFPQERMAKKTGELVIGKIKKNEYPAITENELRNILSHQKDHSD